MRKEKTRRAEEESWEKSRRGSCERTEEQERRVGEKKVRKLRKKDGERVPEEKSRPEKQ